MESDPIGIQSGYNHLYVYVANNPVNWVDPLGLLELEVSKSLSKILISDITQYAQNGGQVMNIMDLLLLFNFPPDSGARLLNARGDVKLRCPNATQGTFTNSGTKIKETIPGSWGVASITLGQAVSGNVIIKSNEIILENTQGIKLTTFGISHTVTTITLTPGKINVQW